MENLTKMIILWKKECKLEIILFFFIIGIKEIIKWKVYRESVVIYIYYCAEIATETFTISLWIPEATAEYIVRTFFIRAKNNIHLFFFILAEVINNFFLL